MKWNTEVVERLWLLSHGANWAMRPQSQIQPANGASLGCGHPSLGPGGQQIGPNHTTLWGDWHQLHCAYWQGPPSGKTTQGRRGWSWIRAPYRDNWFLEWTWLTGPLNCPNLRFSPKEALESQRRFQVHVWWSLGFLMVIVVEVQAMNILEMHLVAWSFKSKQRSMRQDRALMTEEGIMLLTTARTPDTRGWWESARQTCSVKTKRWFFGRVSYEERMC